MLLKIFLILLLICVYIVANKIASDNIVTQKPQSNDVVVEVRNDTTMGKKHAVKIHRMDVSEYDYWLHTDEEYKVGQEIGDGYEKK